MDAGEGAAVAEVEEVVVVEEELGPDVVGTGVDFGFEEVEFGDAVGCGGVAFREGGDADAEAARVGVLAGFVEFFDEGDEVCGVAEVAF